MAEAKKVNPSEKKVWAAASYLWILSLVVLAARKNNDYVRFHASQGVLLFVISILAFLTGPFMVIVNLVVAVAAIFGIIKALQGDKWEIPVIGGWAKGLGNWIIKTLKL
ncbi:MAG: hypothetical protein CMI53_04370 [Parcubacteria group bacterium]|jgi:uncharacterized membrane protein|nr:hypothetical protein [Parcubacteria group bacterium]|tara:strand:- start:2713 stop:3039 length:327 start_codon:yes stop_codon:yes gene_type:complete